MGKKGIMKLLIRADANKKVAMGHVMRCLSVADAFRSTDADVIFVCASPDAKKMITERGYECIVMHTDFSKTMNELDKLVSIIRITEADMVLCDGYYFSAPYFERLKKHVSVAYMDDYGKDPYPVDVLINYNIYGDGIDYERLYLDAGVPMPKMLIGPEYAPLRKAFLDAEPIKIKKKGVFNILVSTGGADPCGIAKVICERFLSDTVGESKLGVLIGPFSPDLEKIKKLAAGSDGSIVVHQNIIDMPTFLSGFDIALSAAGSTTYELCRMGIPTCLFSSADNQNMINQTFSDRDICASAGNADRGRDAVVDRLIEFADKCIHSYELRSKMAERMRSTVDALGAARIAEEMMNVL